jgi:hypothetical protein
MRRRPTRQMSYGGGTSSPVGESLIKGGFQRSLSSSATGDANNKQSEESSGTDLLSNIDAVLGVGVLGSEVRKSRLGTNPFERCVT